VLILRTTNTLSLTLLTVKIKSILFALLLTKSHPRSVQM
jgi:hypothetical protein